MTGRTASQTKFGIRDLTVRSLHGFTLVELMVTIAVLAILLMIAVPSFNEAAWGSNLNSIVNSFVSSAQRAPTEGISAIPR